MRDVIALYLQKHTPKFDVKIRSTSGRSSADAGTQYTWAPTIDPELVEKYMSMIPEEDRPIAGTEGAQRRRQRLAYQVIGSVESNFQI